MQIIIYLSVSAFETNTANAVSYLTVALLDAAANADTNIDFVFILFAYYSLLKKSELLPKKQEK